jgi:hypothetical protein
MKQVFIPIVAAMLQVIVGFSPTYAQELKSNTRLIQNVKIFNGMNDKLAEGMSVLVEGNKIAKIAKAITARRPVQW